MCSWWKLDSIMRELSKWLTLWQELMNKKELVGDLFNNLRLARQRNVNTTATIPVSASHNGDGAGHDDAGAMPDQESINSTLAQLLMVMERLDARIGDALALPLLPASSKTYLYAAEEFERSKVHPALACRPHAQGKNDAGEQLPAALRCLHACHGCEPDLAACPPQARCWRTTGATSTRAGATCRAQGSTTRASSRGRSRNTPTSTPAACPTSCATRPMRTSGAQALLALCGALLLPAGRAEHLLAWDDTRGVQSLP